MDLFDVAVIGGGITGASSANHLAAAGYRTLLLEAGDFGSGTTSRTSRLQYSGLAYLGALHPTGRLLRHPFAALEAVRLARRAMRDRSAFIRAVPERVRPVPLFLPVFRGGPVSLRKMRLGLRLMEWLDPGGVPLQVRVMSPAEARADARLRHLRDLDRLAGVIACVEHQFHWPERICLDTVLNAEESGARVENHMPVTGLARDADGAWRITAWDKRGGAPRQFRSTAVLNAAGAWVDDIAASAKLGLGKLNQGEKGSNAVVRLPAAFEGIGFESLTRGGEPFYVLPWGRLHYFGPANRPQAADADGYRVGEDEIAFLLGELNWMFPTLGLTRADVLYSWAGVRPRTARRGHPSGGPAVRLHDLSGAGAPNYFAYTGGLLMTHASAGREVVAGIGRRVRPSRAARTPVIAARLPPTQADAITLRGAGGPVTAKGLIYACQHEKVHELEDVLSRRLPLGWDEELGCDLADEVAGAIRHVMGWSEEDARGRAAAYRERVRSRFGLAVDR